MFSWLCLQAYKPFYLVTLMRVCVCVYKPEREGDARINTKPSGRLLLPHREREGGREGTGHPAEDGRRRRRRR